jgi:hypothetical protein
MKKYITFLILLLVSLIVLSQEYNYNKSIDNIIFDIRNINKEKIDENTFLYQDFETGIVPPLNWILDSGITSSTWEIADTNVAITINGNYFAICRFDNTYNSLGQDEKLCTPVLDLSGLDDAKLSFFFLFNKYWGIYPYDNYDFEVILSTDSGLTFGEPIWTELSTDTASWETWEWVKAEVDLSGFVGQSNVQICFRYIGFDGADLAIDDVYISFLSSINEKSVRQLKVYPNPTSNFVKIDINEEALVDVFDIEGKLVKSKNILRDDNIIDLAGLNKGVYFLSINYKDKIEFSKIIIE